MSRHKGSGAVFGGRHVAAMLAIGAVCVLAVSPAQAVVQYRLSQESSAGAGDFDSNVLGFINPYVTAGTIAAYYSYNVPNGASWNGPITMTPDESHLFLVSASDGLHLVSVHDQALDGDGGSAKMRFDLAGGDTAAFTVEDDPAEGTSVAAGGTIFTTMHNWIACCTDGAAIGSLDGAWTMFAQFTASPSGIGGWRVKSSGGADTSVSLATGRRVRIDVIPAPGAVVLAMIGIGMAGRIRSRRAAA